MRKHVKNYYFGYFVSSLMFIYFGKRMCFPTMATDCSEKHQELSPTSRHQILLLDHEYLLLKSKPPYAIDLDMREQFERVLLKLVTNLSY